MTKKKNLCMFSSFSLLSCMCVVVDDHHLTFFFHFQYLRTWCFLFCFLCVFHVIFWIFFFCVSDFIPIIIFLFCFGCCQHCFYCCCCFFFAVVVVIFKFVHHCWNKSCIQKKNCHHCFFSLEFSCFWKVFFQPLIFFHSLSASFHYFWINSIHIQRFMFRFLIL